jgi:hypothetical protein
MSNNTTAYTYVTTWTAFRTIKHLYDQAWQDSQRKDEALALRLAALNMCFFSLEAFLNHLIQALNPKVWSQERQYFSGRKKIDGKKYYGPIGKLKYVHVLCNLTYDNTVDSIQTVTAIKEYRDTIAHGRTYHYKAEKPLSQTANLFTIATHEILLLAFQHFDILRCDLFDEVKKCYPDIDIGAHPNLSISSESIGNFAL